MFGIKMKQVNVGIKFVNFLEQNIIIILYRQEI